MVLGSCAEPEAVPTPEPTPTPKAPAPTPKAPAPTPKAPAPTPKAPPAEVDKYGGILRIPIEGGPTTPGYPPESNPQSLDAGRPALETFMRIWTGGVVEPLLATAWEIAPDGTSITLSLRQGVKFHDGTDFDAVAAKWNIDKHIEAEAIRGFESVDVLDDYTIRVNVTQYKNTLLNDIGGVHIVSPTAVENNGLEWARINPVGAGPFIFEKYERDSKLVYKRNPNYWDKDKPYLDGIEIVVIKDETVRKIAFENGEITFMRAIGLTAQDLRDKGYDSVSMSGGTFVLIPDSDNPDSPLADKNVRLAMSHALNREEISMALGYGFTSPAYQLYPGWEPIPGLEKHSYDPDKARQLLADAGYSDGFKTSTYGFPKVIPREYLEAIAGMLRKVGIDVTTNYPEAGAYQQLRFEGWEGMMGHAIFATQNLNLPIEMYFDGRQFPNLKRPSGLREALDASYYSPSYDPAKMQAIIQLIHDDVMVIPYLEEVAIDFVQTGVYDMHLLEYSLDDWVYEDAWLDPDLR